MTISQIAEVNHWRGQCLDNFARVEQAIIQLIERWKTTSPTTAPTLAETASARSRNLSVSLQKHAATDPKAKQLVKLLELWSHRERDRNDLVHGIFTIKTSGDRWTVINRTISVKKQVANSRDDLRSAAEADAFLAAVISERKILESALSDYSQFL
jgi:hypothetical protein